MKDLVVSWFSAGVSSAVATKLLIDKIDRILYIHIDDQPEDSLRFVQDCEKWFGKEIEIMQSEIKTVEEACLSVGYLVGPAGAPCTKILKVVPRLKWELQQSDNLTYVWGMDYSNREIERSKKVIAMNPNQEHIFPLIDQKISKVQAHEILNASGIKRPEAYDQGFHNHNCRGCLKASGAAYWNLTRKIHPEVFDARAKLERKIGASCMKKTVDGETVRLWLDELDPEAGRGMEPIVDECGILCNVLKID